MLQSAVDGLYCPKIQLTKEMEAVDGSETTPATSQKTIIGKTI